MIQNQVAWPKPDIPAFVGAEAEESQVQRQPGQLSETQPENGEYILRGLGPGSGAESTPDLPTCPA